MSQPKTIYEELTITGDDWADKHEAAEMLRETQKILKAKLMRESQEKSISAKELEAFCDARYEVHVISAVKATGDEARAKVKYERAKIKADLWRTQNANQRAIAREAV